MKKAIFAFSGDPIHYGHMDIIQRAAKIFDELIIGIGVNPDKKYLFTQEEKIKMTEKALGHLPNVKVISFSGLLVDYAYENKIPVIVKGVRDEKDFSYESLLNEINESQRLGIDTFLLMTNRNKRCISSSTVKTLQEEQGLIHELVPLHVKQSLEERISKQYIVGVTGEIGAGKTYISEKLKEVGNSKGIQTYNIELDTIGHQILETLEEPLYAELRKEVEKTFGKNVRNKDGFINRKKLGDMVFSDKNKLKELNALMYTPLMVRLRRGIYKKSGLILLNASLLVESSLLYLSNNNIILVGCNEESQKRRLKERGYNNIQIQTRVTSQYNFAKKKKKILEQISNDKHGRLWVIDNSDGTKLVLEDIFNQICEELKII